jgi:hypothetical protein
LKCSELAHGVGSRARSRRERERVWAVWPRACESEIGVGFRDKR